LLIEQTKDQGTQISNSWSTFHSNTAEDILYNTSTVDAIYFPATGGKDHKFAPTLSVNLRPMTEIISPYEPSYDESHRSVHPLPIAKSVLLGRVFKKVYKTTKD